MKASGGPPRNSFRRMFHGEVLDSPKGSIIRGRFRLHFFVRAFMFVWLTGITYAAVRVLLTPGNWPFVAFPVLVGWFGLAIVRWCISVSRPGEDEVVNYLRGVVNGSSLVSKGRAV